MIRLMSYDSDHDHFILTEFDEHIPAYAILSHTWNRDNSREVLLQDVESGRARDKLGYRKLEFIAERAKADGLIYFWLDNVCINKSNDPETSESINSMFHWYRKASRCYVYLEDVEATIDNRTGVVLYDEAHLRTSRWFTRGWTLQELLAPTHVEFFAKSRERLGDRRSLEVQLQQITGIPQEALRGGVLSDFSVTERKSWVAKRQTKKEEDMVYSLLGIFGVSMSIRYGEGKELAWQRLDSKIAKGKRSIEAAGFDANGSDIKRQRTQTFRTINPDSTTPNSSREALLEFLSFDEINDRLANIKDKQAKTCRWLLTYPAWQEWLTLTSYYQRRGVLWLKGKPGSGKSTLMKFAFNRVKDSLGGAAMLLSFFFNARGAELEKSTLGLYRSLIVQLLHAWSENETPEFEALCQQSRHMDELRSDEVRLKGLFKRLIRMQHGNVVLMVDALDECGEDQVRDMISFLEELGDDSIADGREFRVLFSSRHYPRITAESSLEITLEDLPGHTQDIEQYVSSKFKALKGKLGEKLRAEVLKRSSGIFIWVV